MPSILVIDDSKTVITALGAYLGKHGYEVVVPQKFVEIPALLEQHKPDVVVLDLNMPALSGEQIGQFLRRHHYAGRIVVYSGESSEKAEAAAKKIGAHSYVSKEAPLENLLAAIQERMAPVLAR
jgi:DNA-binding response OmpR family regulator